MENKPPSSAKMHVGCRNGIIRAINIATPLGNMVLQYCNSGIHSLNLDSSVHDGAFTPEANQRVVRLPSEDISDKAIDPHAEAVWTNCVDWLDCYFHNPDKLAQMTRPFLCWEKKGSFSQNCLEQLPVIAEFGKIVSYTDLAVAAGNSKATRAAGGAMRHNPVIIVVPCHRVITKRGAMGMFSGGTRQKIKKWLLEHEGHTKFA